jgi:predicted permease
MTGSSTVLSAVIPVFGIAGVGLLIRRLDWLTEEADRSLLRVVINVLMPCLILDSTLGNPALQHWRNLALPPLVGFATVTAGMAVAWALARWCGLRPGPEQRTFALSVGLYNYSYVPIPLAALLFDDRTMGVLFVHNVGAETCLWTLGLMILTGGACGGHWRQIINAPLITILVALFLNFTGAGTFVPAGLLKMVHILGQCAIPLALILVGAIIADHLDEFHRGESWRTIGGAAALRLGVLPLLFLLLARYLPASAELKRVIVLQAAMPAAVFPVVMASHYQGDAPTALRVVMGTAAISLVTAPLWIPFGLKFAGL